MKKHARKTTAGLPNLFLGDYSSQSQFAESYRSLRTNIAFSSLDEQIQTLLVTSAGAEEGKSTTVANLAYTIAQGGRTVLMIDADLRKPMLSRLAADRQVSGLSGLLSETFGETVDAGSLGDYRLGDLYRLIGFRKRSGILSLTSEAEQVDLHFARGRLCDVQWPTRPSERKLANYLLKNQILTKEQAETALQRKKQSGQKLGTVLITLGLVTEERLSGILNLHMIEGLRLAMNFSAGQFTFQRLPASRLEQPGTYNPTDLEKTYRQVVLGEEPFTYLSGAVTRTIAKTKYGNLFVLPSGRRVPKPAELIGSERMEFLLARLRMRFDMVLIDSPPVLMTSDPLVLAPHIDGALLVVKAGMLNRESVQKAVESMRMAKLPILGVALNQINMKRHGYYYKYYYKYYDRYYGKKTG